MSESKDTLVQQLQDKFKKEVLDQTDAKAVSLELVLKKIQELDDKVVSFLTIISGIVGTAAPAATAKTPKPSVRKSKVNNNVMDLTTLTTSYAVDKKAEAASTAIIEESKKTKYICNCVNYIIQKKLKFSQLKDNCNIDVSEVQTFGAKLVGLEGAAFEEKLKDLIKRFLESKDEIQKQRIKKYIDSLDFTDGNSSLSHQ